MPHHPGDLGVAAEGSKAREKRFKLRSAQQFIGQEAQRVQIAGGTNRAKLFRRHFRGHVLRGPLQKAAGPVVDATRQPKIAHLDPPLSVQQQIARLDVAVNHAIGVEEPQGLQTIEQRRAEVIEVDSLALALALQTAVHPFQHQPAARANDVVNRQHVGMRQRGQELGLLPIAGQLLLIGEKLCMDSA